MEWHYLDPSGHQTGPVTEQELRRLLTLHVLNPSTLVWSDGQDRWRPAQEALGLPRGYGWTRGVALMGGCFLASCVALLAAASITRSNGLLGVLLVVLGVAWCGWTFLVRGSRGVVRSRTLSCCVLIGSGLGAFSVWANDQLVGDREAALRVALSGRSIETAAAAFEELAVLDAKNPLLLEAQTPTLLEALERRREQREQAAAELAASTTALEHQRLLTAQVEQREAAVRDLKASVSRVLERSAIRVVPGSSNVELNCSPAEGRPLECTAVLEYKITPADGLLFKAGKDDVAEIANTWYKVSRSVATEPTLSPISNIGLEIKCAARDEFGVQSWVACFEASLAREWLARVSWQGVFLRDFLALTAKYADRFVLHPDLVPFVDGLP